MILNRHHMSSSSDGLQDRCLVKRLERVYLKELDRSEFGETLHPFQDEPDMRPIRQERDIFAAATPDSLPKHILFGFAGEDRKPFTIEPKVDRLLDGSDR